MSLPFLTLMSLCTAACTAVWTPVLVSDPVKLLYPPISDTVWMECDCVDATCVSVYWFYTNPTLGQIKYLGWYNNAGRDFYSPWVDKSRFKFSIKSSSSYTLRVVKVEKEDGGIYSCVLKTRNNGTERWRTGSFLQPGVSPTSPPKPMQPKKPKPACECPKKTLNAECKPLVLWPMVGAAAALSGSLLCTLYYFSRLPKKCRHHFSKARTKL